MSNFENELITIIVPVYQAEGFVGRCLQSIANQEYSNFRVLMIDDCSKDRSKQICQSWADKDSRFELISLKKNGGIANARNIGLEHVNYSDSYIAFVDSDDYLHPQYFSYLHSLLKEYDADFSWCGVHNTFEKEKLDFEELPKEDNIYTLTGKQLLLREDLRIMYSMVWGKLFKSFLWKNIRFDTSYKYYEDGATTFKAIYNARKVVVTSKKLYNYYYSENSSTRSEYNSKRIMDGIGTETDKIAFYKEKGEEELIEMAYVAYLNTLLKSYIRVRFEKYDKEMCQKIRSMYISNYKRVLKNNSLKYTQRLKYIIYRFFPNAQHRYIKLKLRLIG
ncbi:glycosyltransferase family 2 protein [Butyrivibrio sp. NC3005]|uniref:glycosyltransferase family 2 protein n=1 Tax=Butyrivibrio sp. NC3005 TaxID=1280685 RepID=UPI0003FB32AF|nr:glycosyltransferase family 2 protein [Butyrivibrio sp. NC3005]